MATTKKKTRRSKKRVSYKVNQVLYVALNGQTKVIPVLVVEEVVKRSATGEKITYMVQAGNNDENITELAKIDGEVFETPKKVREFLINRATNAISALIDQANTAARDWYPAAFEGSLDPLAGIKKVQPKTKTNDNDDDSGGRTPIRLPQVQGEKSKITLEDGTVANIVVSEPRDE